MANKYLDDVGLTHLWTKIKDYVLANSNKYTLPTATTSTLGGVKLGSDTVQTIAATTVSSTSNRTYAIQTNSSGQLVVNVPWSNSNTTLSGLARCTTAAATAAKTATMPGFSLSSGQYILLRTTVTNSATSNVTLSVNSTTAKPVKIGTSSTTPNASNFPAGDYLANYDGTNWVLTRIYLTDNNTHRSWRVNSNVVSGLSSTTTDVNLVAGDNVTISASGTDITFAATDTKYSNATTTAAGLMSATDKDKLDKIASGAEVNVQSDWSVTDTNSDAYIKNKPTIPTVNNGTLTIQGNGTAASTFTANQSGNTTLNIKGSGGTTVTKSANNEITISTGTIPTGGAASKNVDTSISAASTSTNLPTSQAVAAFVEGKGYKTTDNNTATAADNILDGSNSGTEITYKPYNAQQSKLSFDTSTTNPTRTDRLNLNGYLYATKLYSGGSEALTLAGAQTVTGLKTFSNANFGSVKVKRTDTNAASIIFENSNGTLGSIGMTQTANGGLVRWNTDTSKSYKVWDSGNHGANSGLDADKLDGQDGSYYLNYNNFTNRPSIPTVPTVANGNIVVGNSSSALSDSGVSLTTLQEIASGATNTYVAKNQAESFTLASASVTSQPAEGTKAIRISSFKDINDAVVTASALKVGDIILLTAVDEPDWFVATVGSGFVTLAELETRKIDLDPYVTSVKVGTTSYSPSSGVVTLPAYPTSLKNPNAVTIQAGGATISTYDGSAAKTFNIAASTTAGAFTISDGTTTKTVQLAGTFTDNNTKNTAGATDTSSKIYLVGATSQNDNPQTYSDNEVYATSGVLTTKKTQVGGGSVTMEYDSTYKALKFVF